MTIVATTLFFVAMATAFQNPQLARLDAEVTRVYELALTAPALPASQKGDLISSQRAWLTRRDACGKNADQRQCAADLSVSRIHELRDKYASARSADHAGISKGPFVTQCPGVNSRISTLFVNGDPSIVSLKWSGHALVLTSGPSASGVRYARTYPDGEYVFWEKGNETLFQRPGQKDVSCTITGAPQE